MLPANYRPINVSVPLYRLFSACILDCWQPYLDRHHVINDQQFGFRPVRNTLLAAFSFISVQEAAIVEKRACMADLIDFSSVYDTVHLPILERKLVALGFHQQSATVVQILTYGVSPRVKCLDQQGEPWKMMCGLRQ